ncbi:MAG: MFS transporter [Micrococcaceae bacterium]
MTPTMRDDAPLARAFQIYAPSLVYSLGVGAVTPAIAAAASFFGASLAMAAASVTLIGVGSLIANAPAAQLASRAGERTTIIVSACWGTLGVLTSWCMVAGWFGMTSASAFVGFLIGILMIGMAGAGFNLARQSYLAVAVPHSHRARAMSLLGGMMRIGMFAGPFIGSGVQALMGLQGAFAVGAVAMGAAMVISFWIEELEPRRASSAESPGVVGAAEALQAVTHPSMRSLARRYWKVLLSSGIGVLCLAATRASRSAVIPLWAEHIGLSPAQASLIYGIAGAVDTLMFYPAGTLMDRRGRRMVAVPCLAVLAAGMAVVPFAGTAGWLIVAAVLIGLGNGFGAGIVMTLGADYSPAQGRAKFLGLWRLLSDAGFLLGPMLVAGVTAVFTLAAGVWALAGLAGIGALIFARTLPGGPGPVAK